MDGWLILGCLLGFVLFAVILVIESFRRRDAQRLNDHYEPRGWSWDVEDDLPEDDQTEDDPAE